MAGNDVTILASIMGILLCMGILMPFVYEMVQPLGAENFPDYTYREDDNFLDSSVPDFGDLWGFTRNIGTSFFWYWSWMPAWLISIHVLLRVVGLFIIIRLVRGTG